MISIHLDFQMISLNQPKIHTSLALIDRLCRTIRDIAFNLNIEHISHQQIMDLILYYYNNTRHETLTSTLFKAYH